MDTPLCSAKGCRAPATRVVLWNNPKLHTPDREKPWHACSGHVEHLSDYLDVRGFLLRVELLAEAAEEAPEGPTVTG